MGSGFETKARTGGPRDRGGAGAGSFACERHPAHSLDASRSAGQALSQQTRAKKEGVQVCSTAVADGLRTERYTPHLHKKGGVLVSVRISRG